MIYKSRNKGEQFIYYNIKQWKIKVTFNVPKNISEHVNLVHFVDMVGNVNHAVTISGICIFDLNGENHFRWLSNYWIIYVLLWVVITFFPRLKWYIMH